MSNDLAYTIAYDTRDPDLVLDLPLRPWSATNIAVLASGVVFVAVLVVIWWFVIVNELG